MDQKNCPPSTDKLYHTLLNNYSLAQQHLAILKKKLHLQNLKNKFNLLEISFLQGYANFFNNHVCNFTKLHSSLQNISINLHTILNKVSLDLSQIIATLLKNFYHLVDTTNIETEIAQYLDKIFNNNPQTPITLELGEKIFNSLQHITPLPHLSIILNKNLMPLDFCIQWHQGSMEKYLQHLLNQLAINK